MEIKVAEMKIKNRKYSLIKEAEMFPVVKIQ